MLGFKIRLSCTVLYLGHIKPVTLKRDRCLVKILLTAARRAITRSWYKSESPKQNQWFDDIQEIWTMERLTCVLGLREDLFAKRRQKWLLYLETI